MSKITALRMAFDKCKLSKIIGDINLIAAKKKLKRKSFDKSFKEIYFAKIFYVFCEDVKGIKKCNDIMDFLGADPIEIEIEMNKLNFDPIKYVDGCLDDVYKFLSEEVKSKYFTK